MKILLAYILGMNTLFLGGHHQQKVAMHTAVDDAVVQQQVQQEVYYASVPVLTYHTIDSYTGKEGPNGKRFKVDPKTLDKQFTYLRDHGYTVIPVGDLVDALQKGTQLPEKPVVITFDDGDISQYKNALPLLEQYNYSATFFIYTLVIGKKHYMTWDQVRELETKGMTIGGHTKTHAYLTKITDDVLLQDEIAGGKKLVEEKLGHSISVFAYPFYMHNEHVEDVVKQAGYSAGFAGWEKGPDASDHMYALKRSEPSNDMKLFPSVLAQ